ncbi:RNA ligase family protein [Cytobacillus oceanisediminis]|uniref:ATP-dependent DNA ligase n=1 Tax=Cytobacillus oceanisediminis 2691 TaxID=1196031 RepID=A0A160MA54_9BACI|nr:RNA ligase family protein [Cytobacillus oceanisediminis]AND39636.1 ATP-dependent DNA ligase [Cytobacillus oceanisediminis 2691]
MFISPMLLQKSEEPFDNSDYITELKLDGIRLIYSVDTAGKVRLYSRHNNEITAKFPELHSLDLPPGTVLDGELIVTDSAGKPDFEAMMSRFQSSKSTAPVSFVVFDVLQREGERVTGMSLLERKELLADLVPTDSGLLSKVQFVEGHGAAYYNAVQAQGLEGIVLKRKDSRYQVGKRSDAWLKVINYQYADVYVTGYRTKEFGWLLADDGKYLGVMELGVPPHARAKVYRAEVREETADFAYLADPVKCRVKFRNYTKAGLLRLPSFVEWV